MRVAYPSFFSLFFSGVGPTETRVLAYRKHKNLKINHKKVDKPFPVYSYFSLKHLLINNKKAESAISS